MKIIGITGSYGKTSVAEILYEYLMKSKVKTSLYCSNGFFINKKTRRKDFFKTNLHKNDYIEKLKVDAELGVEIAIIEIKIESIFYDLKLDELIFDHILVTNYDPLKATVFTDLDAHKNAYLMLLSKQKNILINNNVPKDFLLSYSDFKSSGSDCCNEFNLTEYSIQDIKSKYGDIIFQSKLMTYFHIENQICTIALLEKLNLFKSHLFKKTIKNLNIKGRMEFLEIKNKKVVIDNKNHSIKSSIDAIVNSHGNYNYKIFLSILPHQYTTLNNEILNEDILELNKSKWSYLTYDTLDLRQKDPNLNEVKYTSGCTILDYSKNSLVLFDKAIRELKKDEILIIFTKRNYRNYRKHLEGKKWNIMKHY